MFKDYIIPVRPSTFVLYFKVYHFISQIKFLNINKTPFKLLIPNSFL